MIEEMLQEALMAQRQMLVDAIGMKTKPLPYKEVLDVYDQDLNFG